MARSFLGGEFAGGESAWWRGDWIPTTRATLLYPFCFSCLKGNEQKDLAESSWIINNLLDVLVCSIVEYF